MSKRCIKCNVQLDTNSNWTASRKKKAHYICKGCFNSAFKERKGYKEQRKTGRKKKIFDRVLSLKITNVIQGSVKRNKDLEFSYEEIGNMMKEPCHYCGSDKEYCGLDRVDSSKGYIKGNTVPCCKACNYGKHTMTPDEYVAHCEKVILYHGR